MGKAFIPSVEIDRDSDEPLYQQIARPLEDYILSGQVAAGSLIEDEVSRMPKGLERLGEAVELLAEPLVPVNELGAQPHDQKERRIAGVAGDDQCSSVPHPRSQRLGMLTVDRLGDEADGAAHALARAEHELERTVHLEVDTANGDAGVGQSK